jgi:flagellar biosynthetic protein FliP
MLETTGALLVVLALLYGLRALLRWHGLAPVAGGVEVPRIVGGVALGPRKRLCVVDAGGERLLLGVTDSQITLIHALARANPPEGDVAAPAKAFAGWRLRGLLVLLVAAGLATGAAAEAKPSTSGNDQVAERSEEGAGLHIELDAPRAPGEVSSALEMLAFLTLVTVAPAILLMATCFTRIIVVLSLLRQAIGLQHMPPNQVLVGLALFLTMGVMSPVAEEIRVKAYEPYVAEEIGGEQALENALAPVRAFLEKSTRDADLALFLELTHQAKPKSAAEVPITALLPAYVISELRTAFEIGFMVLLPFLVVDLVVSSLLISMGMIVLPPVVVSLPFKLMLFVLADGWNLVLGSLVSSVS